MKRPAFVPAFSFDSTPEATMVVSSSIVIG
jgi:hypothetical protein